jgi:predicted NAD/FAD-binding protein
MLAAETLVCRKYTGIDPESRCASSRGLARVIRVLNSGEGNVVQPGRSNDFVPNAEGQDIAVIGSGIAGLSCAWLLGQRHRVTLYEAATRLGGHSCTVDIATPSGKLAVDMGFIVYNEPTYPNLTALFSHLGVATQPSCMSLGLSIGQGALEYGGHDLAALFAQKRNLVRPRFWSMLNQLLRLYRLAATAQVPDDLSLGEWLDQHRFPAAFRHDHLLPMAAAIWSCAPGAVLQQPAAAFFRFCDNHGLLRLRGRPDWRTVTGGAGTYVAKLAAALTGTIRISAAVTSLHRDSNGISLRLANGETIRHGHAVLACHGDQALAMLQDADDSERRVLSAFRTAPNRAILHADPTLMPKRRRVWSSWNYLARTGEAFAPPCVTYWMNRLQSLPGPDLFVTLNPRAEPAPHLIHAIQDFDHPIFDAATLQAQRDIWHLQGTRKLWFCGAYLGAGFHEDGLQAGLAVAERLGHVRRPWNVPGESSRLYLPDNLEMARAA